jgi:hypothetical protein
VPLTSTEESVVGGTWLWQGKARGIRRSAEAAAVQVRVDRVQD